MIEVPQHSAEILMAAADRAARVAARAEADAAELTGSLRASAELLAQAARETSRRAKDALELENTQSPPTKTR